MAHFSGRGGPMNQKHSLILFSVIASLPFLQLGCKDPTLQSLTNGKKQVHQEILLEDAIYGILRGANQPGSMVVRVDCAVGNKSVQEPYVVPRALSKTTAEDGLDQISAANQSIIWTKSNGFFRVADKNVNPILLRVRLKEFQSEHISQPFDIVNQLWETPEVQEEEKRSGIGRLGHGSFLSGPKPDKTITIDLRDVTVSDVLDVAASKFNGVWVYSECRSSDKVLVDFNFLRYH